MRNRAKFTVLTLLAVAVMVGVPYVWGSDMLDDRRSNAAAPASGAPAGQPESDVSSPARKAAPAAPAAPTLPPLLLHPAPVAVDAVGFWSWTLLDRRTGVMAGSPNAAATQRTASMIKAWLAADYLRRTPNPSNSNLRQLSVMIRNSDNTAASYFWALNGRAAGITRMVQLCGMTDSRAYIDWASTMMSARDAVRMGACIADGRAAGPKWTGWVLNEMRSVAGSQEFGVVPALPPAERPAVAVKNGWIVRSDGKWHVNCLAMGNEWVLSVLAVYPSSKGMGYGANVCSSVTRQLQA